MSNIALKKEIYMNIKSISISVEKPQTSTDKEPTIKYICFPLTPSILTIFSFLFSYSLPVYFDPLVPLRIPRPDGISVHHSRRTEQTINTLKNVGGNQIPGQEDAR